MTDFIVFPNLDPDNVFAPELRAAIANMPEMKLAYAPRTGQLGYISSADVAALLASKLNTSDKGVPLGVAALDSDGKLLEGNLPQRLSEATQRENLVTRFKPRTFYPLNAAIVDPSGDVVLAKAAFTTEDTYNPAQWKKAPIDGGTP